MKFGVKWMAFNLAAVVMSAHAVTIDKIVVFGDSLSDNGNIYSLTTSAHKTFPLIPVIPNDRVYFKGRFSNGPNWIDDLGQMLNVPVADYAYGGSWAESVFDSKISVPFNIGMQVDYYLVGAALDFNKCKQFYVIWTGGNDYIKGREDSEYATTNTIENIKKQMDWLIYYGAKQILLINVPDLGVVPEVQEKGATFAGVVSHMSELHNAKMDVLLAKEIADHPDVKIMLADSRASFVDIITNHDKYNIKNITDACYQGTYWFKKPLDVRVAEAASQVNVDLDNPSLQTAYLTGLAAENGDQPCANPDEYLFWDRIHPTRVAHQIIARLANETLQANNIHGQ